MTQSTGMVKYSSWQPSDASSRDVPSRIQKPALKTRGGGGDGAGGGGVVHSRRILSLQHGGLYAVSPPIVVVWKPFIDEEQS